jgi:hypothetical protein
MSNLSKIPFADLKAEYIRRVRQQAAALRKKRGTGKGRPRIKPRCPCGKFPVERAAKRNHKCVPPS